MKVLKFGGKTIDTPDKFRGVADMIKGKTDCIIVVPAIPAITNGLEDIANYLFRRNIEGASEDINKLKRTIFSFVDMLSLSDGLKVQAAEYVDAVIEQIKNLTKDLFTIFEERFLLAQGELISAYLFSLLMSERNVKIEELPALEFMRIDKNSEPETGFIKEKLTALLKEKTSSLYYTQGYICTNAYGEIDDFRKGGNDFTATLIGAAIEADEIQIWTEMNGMYNIDPSIIKTAKLIENISFDEAAELAYFGDKILHPSSVLPAKMANIPVHVLSILNPEAKGTLISEKTVSGTIKAVAAKDDITMLRVNSGKMLLAHGFLRRVFEVFEHYQTPIDMLASSEVGISLTVDNNQHVKDIADDLKKYGRVSVETDMTIICIVGDLESNSGEGRKKVIEALKELPINMISYGGSDYNFSFLIKSKDEASVLEALNTKLFK
ncbi:MAG: aspartate kinase [Dysgonomonas sp.]